ncbi:MAG: PAS domain S-box protein [Nitrospinae bacterium]|nr:PAS domain S-box protein [Nitrospinota bacterium]
MSNGGVTRKIKTPGGDGGRSIAQNNGLLEKFFALSQDIMCVAGRDGYFKKLNPAFARISGFTEQELLGRPFMEFIHPDDRPGAQAALEKLLSGMPVVDFENRLLCQDGSCRWLEWQAAADLESGLFFATARDVTERKKADAALGETRRRYQLLVESSPFCIHEIDMEGRLQSMNRAGLAMLGLAEERQVCGVDYMSAVSEEDKGRIENLLKQAYLGNLSHFEFASSGKTPLYFKSCFVPIRDESGKVIKLMGITEDITERHNMEGAIRKSEERMRQVVEASPVGMVMTDKNQDPVIINNKFVEMFGYTFEDFRSIEGWWPLAYPDKAYRSRVMDEWNRKVEKAARKRRNMEPMEARVTCKNGDVKDILFNFSAVGEFGLVVFNDITRLKKAEEKLRNAKEAAEQATTLKDKFVSLVAHDLKSPLSSALGLMRLVRNEIKPSESGQTEVMMDSVISSSENMLRMIGEVLNISRLKTGKINLAFQFINAYQLGILVLAGQKETAAKKGVALINNIPPDRRIYADAILLGEVLSNLVSNAIKFSRNGDSVTLSVPEDEKSAIVVRDTGVGMAPETTGKLFLYDEKTSTPGTAGEQGAGFGLPLSHDIMEAHGGSLTVESKPDQGSVFFARLPFVTPRVMVVDDEASTRLHFRKILEGLGAEVIEAENGASALESVWDKPPHLMLLDITMPVMDGFGALEGLKRDNMISHIPVIAVTANDDMTTREKAFKMGAVDYLKKPVDINDFVPRVRRIIG